MQISLTLMIQKIIHAKDDEDYERQLEEIEKELDGMGFAVNLEDDSEAEKCVRLWPPLRPPDTLQGAPLLCTQGSHRPGTGKPAWGFLEGLEGFEPDEGWCAGHPPPGHIKREP